MPPADLEVRPSRIAGRGVFARVDLAEGTVVTGPLNHSCDPNAWFADEGLVARRAIPAGDELTYDYATGTADGDLAMYCHCETYRCRQLIAGDDWRIPQLQQRYAGHWAPHLQRLIDALPQ